MPNEQALNAVLKARSRIAKHSEFFASIIYNAKLIESEERPTMWTNGIHIFYNPDFVLKNREYIPGVLLHEVLHCALNHVARRRDRNPMLWNVVCDWVVNPIVTRSFELPEKALRPPWNMRDKSAEAMYALQEKEQQEKQESQKDEGDEGDEQPGQGDEGDEQPGQGDEGNEQPGQGKQGDEQPGQGKQGDEQGEEQEQPASEPMQEPTREELAKAEREWKRVMTKAVEASEKAGWLPPYAKRLLAEMFPQEKIDWRTMLERMVKEARTNVSGSWSRPNRRYAAQGYRMPGPQVAEVYRLVVCLDCSGSVSDDQHQEMRGEVGNLLDSGLITHATVLAVDTGVRASIEVCHSTELESFEVPHGGGTDFAEAMDVVAKLQDTVGCVFLTDMRTQDYGKDPGIPMLWVNWMPGTNYQTPEFGQVVDYDK